MPNRSFHDPVVSWLKLTDWLSPRMSSTCPVLVTDYVTNTFRFEKAEATFPYPFKTPTEDLIVVKQSKAVYDSVSLMFPPLEMGLADSLKRIAPFFQQASPVIQDVINRTAEINSALGARAGAVIQSSSDISHALIEQLKQLADQGKDLPAALIDVSRSNCRTVVSNSKEPETDSTRVSERPLVRSETLFSTRTRHYKIGPTSLGPMFWYVIFRVSEIVARG